MTKKFISSILLISCMLCACNKENSNVCKFIRNDDLKQEYSLKNLYDWECEVDDYKQQIGEESLPQYGVKLYNTISNKDSNFIYLYYQYGDPQIRYPIPEALKDIQFNTDHDDCVEMFVWSYDYVYLQVIFKSAYLTNYSIFGIFEKNFYSDNEDKILEVIKSVQINVIK